MKVTNRRNEGDIMIRQIKIYYLKLQAPIKASMWFLICGFMQKGISMLTTPVFTRLMTDIEYGRYSIYQSWLGIAEIIITLNLAAGVYTRGLIKNEADQDRFSSSMVGLSTTLVLIWSVIYWLLHKQINQLTDLNGFLMTAMLVETWAHAAYQFWSNRERVNYRYKKLVVITIIYVILRPLVGIVFVMMADIQYQTEARVLSMTLTNVLIFSFLYVSIMRKGKKWFDKDYWLYALKFNIPLLPHYLAQVVLSQSDRIMINEYCGPTEAAYYSVAYTLAMVLQILNTSVSATMNPWIYKSIKRRDFRKIAKVSYCVLALIVGMNLLAMLLAPELLGILAPQSYQAALGVVPPVMVSVYFMFLYNLFATFEYYYEKTHYAAIATVSGAVINVVLNAVFIPRCGFIAAGYTTLVCYVLYAVAHYFFMKKVNRKCMNGIKVYDCRIISAFGAVLLIGARLISLLYRWLMIRYGILICLMIAVVIMRKSLLRMFRVVKSRF